MSFLWYSKVIPCAKFEHFGIIRFWVMIRKLVWKMYLLTLWPWPLPLQPQNHIISSVSQGHSLYQLWTPWASYPRRPTLSMWVIISAWEKHIHAHNVCTTDVQIGSSSIWIWNDLRWTSAVSGTTSCAAACRWSLDVTTRRSTTSSSNCTPTPSRRTTPASAAYSSSCLDVRTQLP